MSHLHFCTCLLTAILIYRDRSVHSGHSELSETCYTMLLSCSQLLWLLPIVLRRKSMLPIFTSSEVQIVTSRCCSSLLSGLQASRPPSTPAQTILGLISSITNAASWLCIYTHPRVLQRFMVKPAYNQPP